MGMVKVFSPSGWDFDAPTASMIKIASGGLRGHDRAAFVKRASAASNIFLPYLDSVKFAADETPVHLIALGASEFYGPNRNGDGFKAAACKNYHDTFVKYARFYRNHKNKDPAISYGLVKLSAYNPEMERVELLVALNNSKSAADRNGGFIADRELHKLASGDDLCVSMACRVPYDECSFCHHKARTRDEYCTSSMCKAGGCADNLTRLVKMGTDTHHLHVNNSFPTFFDISDVFRPADRTAWGSRADYLEKAASYGGFFEIGGAKTAEDMGIAAPLDVLMSQETPQGHLERQVFAQVKLCYGLAALQKQAMDGGEVRRAFGSQIQPELDLTLLDADDHIKLAGALGALADRKIILSLRDFARLTKRASLIPVAAEKVAGVYDRMLEDGSLERRLTKNAYAPAETWASAKQRNAAAELVPGYSLEKSAVERRCLLSSIRQYGMPAAPLATGMEKSAADGAAAEDLARDYGCYKAAALERIARTDGEFILTARYAEWQNRAV